jgi:RNA polymerase sigma-70 factor (ECF subfamily)
MLRAQFEAELPTHLPSLRALARRLVGHRDEAQDIVQEALLRANTGLSRFRGESSLKTWLFSITTRVAIDHLRSSRRWDTQVMVDACDERGAASVAEKYGDPSVSFDVQQHLSFCFSCIGRSLSPEGHAAMVLREMFNLPHEEAAKVLDVTESVFRHTLSAARAAMEQEYAGLCALVNKAGACYQCKALRELAPEGRRGPPLPPFPLPFEERLARAREANLEGTMDQRLNDYFFEATRTLQRQKG